MCVLRNDPGLAGRSSRSLTSPDYLPNFHGSLDRNGNATGLGRKKVPVTNSR